MLNPHVPGTDNYNGLLITMVIPFMYLPVLMEILLLVIVVEFLKSTKDRPLSTLSQVPLQYMKSSKELYEI